MAFKDLHYSQMEADIMRKNQSLFGIYEQKSDTQQVFIDFNCLPLANSNFPC